MSITNTNCASCGVADKFFMNDKYFALGTVDVDKDEMAKRTGRLMRVKARICQNCGHVVFFKSSLFEGA